MARVEPARFADLHHTRKPPRIEEAVRRVRAGVLKVIDPVRVRRPRFIGAWVVELHEVEEVTREMLVHRVRRTLARPCPSRPEDVGQEVIRATVSRSLIGAWANRFVWLHWRLVWSLERPHIDAWIREVHDDVTRTDERPNPRCLRDDPPLTGRPDEGQQQRFVIASGRAMPVAREDRF